jgi:hypothetical protein
MSTSELDIYENKLSTSAIEFIRSKLEMRIQANNKLQWTNGKIVIKLYRNRNFFLEVIFAHSLLDKTGKVCKLLSSAVFDNNEHFVIEECVHGRSLSTDSEKESFDIISEYISQLEKSIKRKRTDWDYNPKNYVFNADNQIVMIEVGDCYFEL